MVFANSEMFHMTSLISYRSWKQKFWIPSVWRHGLRVTWYGSEVELRWDGPLLFRPTNPVYRWQWQKVDRFTRLGRSPVLWWFPRMKCLWTRCNRHGIGVVCKVSTLVYTNVVCLVTLCTSWFRNISRSVCKYPHEFLEFRISSHFMYKWRSIRTNA